MDSLSTASEAQVVIVLRLVSDAPDIDAFVAQYGRYLHGDEIFLLTKAPPPPGTHVRFRLELASGETVVDGEGTVTRVHAGHPNLIPGMDVAFAVHDARSRAALERMRSVRVPTRSAARAAPASRRPGVPPPPPPAAMRAPAREPSTTVSDAASTEPQVAAKLRCVISDGIAEYVVEWFAEEKTVDLDERAKPSSAAPGKRPAARLLSSALQRKRLVGASLAGVALLTCMIVWMARSPSARRASQPTVAAAVAMPIVAPAPATSPSTAPSRPLAAPIPSASEQPTPDPLVTADATAALEIKTRPSGAGVSVDGKWVGRSPIAMKIAPGPHDVAITRVRYAPQTATVAAPGRLNVTLKRPGGTLVVESTPSAADVLIEGKSQGKTPLRLAMAAFKSYDVRVAFSNGRQWRQRVYLKGSTTSVRASAGDASLTRR